MTMKKHEPYTLIDIKDLKMKFGENWEDNLLGERIIATVEAFNRAVAHSTEMEGRYWQEKSDFDQLKKKLKSIVDKIEK